MGQEFILVLFLFIIKLRIKMYKNCFIQIYEYKASGNALGPLSNEALAHFYI